MTMGGPRGVVALSAVILIAVGLASGFGVLTYSVVPAATTSGPALHAFITKVTTNPTDGYNATTVIWISALPAGAMNVTQVAISWGGTILKYNTLSPDTGGFNFYRHYEFIVAGSDTISATVHATDGTSTYTATTSPVTVSIPGPVAAGCTHLCPGVSANFGGPVNGLTVTFTDKSTYFNATTTSQAWTFGDGEVGSGSPVSHTYASAGTYEVTLTATATNATGASASGTAFVNITVSSTKTGCQGTCGSLTPGFITPTSGLFIGLGIGALVWVAAWSRPEIGLLAIGGLGLVGFAIGMFAVGSW